MMNSSRRTDLDEMREDLRRRLTTALAAPSGNPKEIEELVKLAQVIESLAQLQPKVKGTNWLLPVFIAAVATGLVGIASLISLQRVPIDIDSTASEFTVQLGKSPRSLGSRLAIERGTLMSVGHKPGAVVADAIEDFANFTGLTDIRFDPESLVTFGIKPGQCYELRIKKGELHGILLRGGSPASDVMPSPARITLAAPGFLKFCTKEESRLFVEELDAMYISTTLLINPSQNGQASHEVFVPSILKGEINLSSINERRTLTSNDRLSIRGIQEGRLVVRFGETLGLSFSGSSSNPRLFGLSGPNSPSGRDLRPSVATVVKSSPELTAILASVAGVATALMGAIRWFGLRGRE